MGAAEFKAQCLKIFDEIEQSGETVTITKRGRPVAEVRPIDKPKREFGFGAMKGTVLAFDDPFSPAYDVLWNAERGVWEPED
jgi:antitoxin (DNA-binding transcriptional repressor) of toxin-antitoxin stability system